MRGGTSKGLFFRADALPADRAARDPIFLAALGSPDPYRRQLDGMGGGLSSLSKIMIVARSARPGIGLDYTFGQVAVDAPVVDYAGNCGNLTSAIGPFGVEEGLVPAAGGRAELRLYNTNTGKVVAASFPIGSDGRPETEGDCVLPGVAGSGAPVRLDFLDVGGAGTGRLLPTGRTVDRLPRPGGGTIEVSVVDASAVVAFVRAGDLGVSGTEPPDTLCAAAELTEALESIRLEAAVACGLADDLAQAARTCRSAPKIAMVAGPRASRLIDGRALEADACDLLVRMISMGLPHLAVPLTGGICLAVAARIEGTLVAEALGRPVPAERDIGIAHPSGLLRVGARMTRGDDGRAICHATVFRTCRRLMTGEVLVPARLRQSGAGPVPAEEGSEYAAR